MSIDNSDFQQILAAEGEFIAVQQRTLSTADPLGDRTYTIGSVLNVSAIVQDASTADMRKYAGIMQYGDKVVFTVTQLRPTDIITIDALTWQIVTETNERSAGTIIFREYLIRRTNP